MESVLIRDVLDKLPVLELEHSLTAFLSPMLPLLPDRRLQRVVPLAVRGILAGETPLVTAMAHSVARTECAPWPAAKRMYRLLDNRRVPPRRLTNVKNGVTCLQNIDLKCPFITTIHVP